MCAHQLSKLPFSILGTSDLATLYRLVISEALVIFFCIASLSCWRVLLHIVVNMFLKPVVRVACGRISIRLIVVWWGGVALSCWIQYFQSSRPKRIHELCSLSLSLSLSLSFSLSSESEGVSQIIL